MIYFENFLDDYYSACKYLQLPCFKFIYTAPSKKEDCFELKFVLIWGVLQFTVMLSNKFIYT